MSSKMNRRSVEIDELEKHASKFVGDEKAKRFTRSIRAVFLWNRYCKQYYKLAKSSMENLRLLRDDDNLVAGFFSGQDEAVEEAITFAGAMITSCVHGVHAVEDNLASALFWGVPGPRKPRCNERNVSLIGLKCHLPNSFEARIDSYLAVEDVVYIGKVNNQSKHRYLVNKGWSVDYDDGWIFSWTISGFERDGVVHETTNALNTLRRAFDAQQSLIFDIIDLMLELVPEHEASDCESIDTRKMSDLAG